MTSTTSKLDYSTNDKQYTFNLGLVIIIIFFSCFVCMAFANFVLYLCSEKEPKDNQTQSMSEMMDKTQIQPAKAETDCGDNEMKTSEVKSEKVVSLEMIDNDDDVRTPLTSPVEQRNVDKSYAL
eukprot:327045_1